MTPHIAYIEAIKELGLDADSDDIFNCAVDIYYEVHPELRYFEARNEMKEWYNA